MWQRQAQPFIASFICQLIFLAPGMMYLMVPAGYHRRGVAAATMPPTTSARGDIHACADEFTIGIVIQSPPLIHPDLWLILSSLPIGWPAFVGVNNRGYDTSCRLRCAWIALIIAKSVFSFLEDSGYAGACGVVRWMTNLMQALGRLARGNPCTTLIVGFGL